MKINDLLMENSMSEVADLVNEVRHRLLILDSADASPQPYINQIGLRFKLFNHDPISCVVYLEILPDPGSTRDLTTKKFERKIISAATAVRPSFRAQNRTYAEAVQILNQNTARRRAIAILTNPLHWTLVDIRYGDLHWKKA